MLIKYSANNSGGSWWLNDDDWHALEKAGWTISWCKDQEGAMFSRKDGRFLGALATEAEKEFNNPKEAIEEFEKITGQSASDEGCNCCGPPHSFQWNDDKGEWHYASGEEVLRYLYDDVPKTLREACERLRDEQDI